MPPPHPIRAYRARRGLTLIELAARAGISKAALSYIETYATRLPTFAVIGRLVAACDGEITPCQIFRAHYEGGPP